MTYYSQQVQVTRNPHETVAEFTRRGYKIVRVRTYPKTGKSFVTFQQPSAN